MRPVRALLLVTLLVAGCSSAPSPQTWASAVCKALVPWRNEIGTLTTRTQQQMNSAVTPGQARTNLAGLFDGAEKASEKARAGVAEAGVPDVSNGKQIAAGFTGSLTALRDAYGRASTSIAGLPLTDANAFYDQVGTVVDQLNKDYQSSSLDTTKLNSPELSQAFDNAPECR